MSRTHTHTYTSTISAITREIERLFVIPKPFVRRSRRLETTDFRDLYTPRAFAETLLAAGRGRFVRVICHGISPIPADHPTSRVYDKYIYKSSKNPTSPTVFRFGRPGVFREFRFCFRFTNAWRRRYTSA